MRIAISGLLVAGTAAAAELASQQLPSLGAAGLDLTAAVEVGISFVLGAFGGSVRGVLRPTRDRPVRFWVYPFAGSFVGCMLSLVLVSTSLQPLTRWAAAGLVGYWATRLLDAADPVVDGLPAVLADALRARLGTKQGDHDERAARRDDDYRPR